ncbi:gluconate kinase [Pedobacter yulinensis]|uniref:Gluconokinase n=1 Tax=Pedobacter yulinensis TaxID=2126353 RepID=A0A2T3HQA9_9SPHI|nr:gluconokinase [Pedobacter yulinensis]PST84583.1 gluconate kinase [Pedobacter yulinensis]
MKSCQVVVMGVSGSGKSVVGEAIAGALGAVFLEGDAFHPLANVEKMSKGIPLQDADRAGWLETLRSEISRYHETGQSCVLSCSALKKSYRDLLRSGAPGLYFLYLHADKTVLRSRLAQREGHYMPLSLLDSQLETLEPPVNEDRAVIIDAMVGQDEVIAACLQALKEKNGN